MHDLSVRTAVRQGYVRRRLPVSEAARQAGVSPATARGWKRSAAAEGDDWDRARDAARLAEGGMGSLTERILAEFAALMTGTIDSLKGGSADPIETSRAMATIADSYVKVVKAAGRSDPQHARRAILIDVVRRLSDRVTERAPALAAELLPHLERFAAEMEVEWS
ncbi:MAG: DUF1804 family protein [Gammaproteobacteria bacterium]|nr:DUF1804 family protein [Gammaproteobacteria bacterium]